jgi:hypothetical protein
MNAIKLPPFPDLSQYPNLSKYHDIVETFRETLLEHLARDGNTSLTERRELLQKSINEQLVGLYAEKFPKKCNCCLKIYQTRESYLEETARLKKNNGIVICERRGVQEFRNCSCGSTLLIVTDNRRDNSEFGEAKRAFFNLCVAYLLQVEAMNNLSDERSTNDEVSQAVREIFKNIIYSPAVSTSFENIRREERQISQLSEIPKKMQKRQKRK